MLLSPVGFKGNQITTGNIVVVFSRGLGQTEVKVCHLHHHASELKVIDAEV